MPKIDDELAEIKELLKSGDAKSSPVSKQSGSIRNEPDRLDVPKTRKTAPSDAAFPFESKNTTDSGESINYFAEWETPETQPPKQVSDVFAKRQSTGASKQRQIPGASAFSNPTISNMQYWKQPSTWVL